MRAGRFADARRGDARFGRPSTVTKERFVAQAPKTTAKGKASAQKKPSSGDEKRVPLKKARQSSADRKAQTSERDEAPVILDARTKRDIAGVVLAVCAIALLLTMILPPSGIVTSFLNDSIRLVLGFGSFLLPFLLGAICACLFIRTDKRYFALRVGAGLSLMIVALLSLLALFTPQGDASAAMFSAAELSARGGYVGAGIAWALLKLFGRAVGAIFLAGVLIAGAVVIGFSISDVVDKVRDAAADRARRRREDEEADLSLFATPPVAGVPMGADAPIARSTSFSPAPRPRPYPTAPDIAGRNRRVLPPHARARMPPMPKRRRQGRERRVNSLHPRASRRKGPASRLAQRLVSNPQGACRAICPGPAAPR